MTRGEPSFELEEAPKPMILERVGGGIVISLLKDIPEMVTHIADIASAIEDSYTDLGGAHLLEVDIDVENRTITVKNPIVEDAAISDEIYDAIQARVERLSTVF